jgi:hypothetical protein
VDDRAKRNCFWLGRRHVIDVAMMKRKWVSLCNVGVVIEGGEVEIEMAGMVRILSLRKLRRVKASKIGSGK